MSLQQGLEQLRQEFRAKISKETLEVAAKADAELAEQQFLRKALKTGDMAPA
jgi:hypothetical protein